MLARLQADHCINAATSQQVQQQRLHLIVPMVRYRDRPTLCHLAQKAVTRRARSILGGALFRPSKFWHIDPPDSAGQAPLVRDACYGGCLLCARFTTELVIQVSNMQFDGGETLPGAAETQQQMQQAERIGSPRDGHNHRSPLGQKVMLFDIGGHNL